MSGVFARRDVTIAAIGLLFAIQAVIRFRSPIAADVAWYLYAGGRLLDGAVLYEDVVEVNPPLGVWMAVPITVIAQALGVGASTVIKAVLLGLTALSVGLTARFIGAAREISPAARHVFLILVAGLMLFLPASDFGQREHLLILLATPWIFLRWNRLVGRDISWMTAIPVGLLAALGLWLKPQFFFVVVSIEVTLLLTSRDPKITLRAENLALIVFSALYPAIVWTLWSSTKIAQIALLGSIAFVPFYGVGPEDFALRLVLPLVLAAAAIASFGLLTERLLNLRAILFVVGATMIGAYVVQAGYGYQAIPALFYLSLAAGLGLCRLMAGDVALSDGWQGLSAAGAAIAIGAVFVGAGSQFAADHGKPLARVIAAEAPHARTIFIASTRVSDSFPLVGDRQLIWASRYPSQWFSPYIATTLDAEGEAKSYLARELLKVIVTDLIAYQPDIVFVDESAERPHYRNEPLDHIAFWQQDERFRAFWDNYEQRGMQGDFGVYVRSEPPPDG